MVAGGQGTDMERSLIEPPADATRLRRSTSPPATAPGSTADLAVQGRPAPSRCCRWWSPTPATRLPDGSEGRTHASFAVGLVERRRRSRPSRSTARRASARMSKPASTASPNASDRHSEVASEGAVLQGPPQFVSCLPQKVYHDVNVPLPGVQPRHIPAANDPVRGSSAASGGGETPMADLRRHAPVEADGARRLPPRRSPRRA